MKDSRKIVLALVAAALFALASAPEAALATSWTAGTASWHDGGNWDGGVPIPGSVADVTNKGTAQITDTAACALLTLGSYSAADNSSVVEQSDGAFTISMRIEMGSSYGRGEYYLSGGQLSVGDDVYVGYGFGNAEFFHSGGVHTITDKLYMGYLVSSPYSRYNLSGTGQLSAATQYIGYKNVGYFHQTGGTNTVDTLQVGYYAGSFGYYYFNGGQLTVVDEYIGGSSGLGKFAHYAGTNEVSGTLRIGGYYGDNNTFYQLHENAVLEVNNLLLTNATLDIKNSGASVTVNGIMTFETNAEYAAVAGSTIHMMGADFRNKSTSSSNVGGLGNTEFIFEGGVGVTDAFEVAGLVDGGFVDNFAMNALTLGGADEGHLQLVDTYNNGNRGTEGEECLFLDDLTINAGSSLDVNGFWLYESGNHATEWHNMIMDGRLTGALLPSAVYDPVNDWTTFGIPEPGTIILIGCGLVGLAGVLRRKLR